MLPRRGDGEGGPVLGGAGVRIIDRREGGGVPPPAPPEEDAPVAITAFEGQRDISSGDTDPGSEGKGKRSGGFEDRLMSMAQKVKEQPQPAAAAGAEAATESDASPAPEREREEPEPFVLLHDDDEDLGGDDIPPPEDDSSWMDAEALARGYEEHLAASQDGGPEDLPGGESDGLSAEDEAGEGAEDEAQVEEGGEAQDVPAERPEESRAVTESESRVPLPVMAPDPQGGDAAGAFRSAPEPRKEAPKPKATTLEISSQGVSKDPVRHPDSAESQAALLQKLRRGVVHIAIGMTGRPPKMNSFAMGAFQPGSTGQVPVEKAPETGRVEAPHDAEDRLVAHKDEAPARTVKVPVLKEEPMDFRFGPEDIEGLFGQTNTVSVPTLPVPSVPLPTPGPVLLESAKSVAPARTPLQTAPSEPPAPEVSERRTSRVEDRLPAESPKKVPAPKAVAKERSGKFGFIELLAVGVVAAIVAALVVRMGSNGSGGEKDGVESLAMGERQVVGLYLDNQLAGIERRITELEAEIHKEAVTPNPKPESLSRMAVLARERAGLLYLAEAVKYRRRLVVQGGQKIDGGKNGGQ